MKPLYDTQHLSIGKADETISFIQKTIKTGKHLIINFHGGEPVADLYSTEWSEKDFLKIKEMLTKVRLYILENDLKNIKINILEEFRCLGRCSAGVDYYSVDVQGQIYPCTFLVGHEEHIIGNVEHRMYPDKLNKLAALINQRVESCEGCQLYDYCLSTRCLLMNYVRTGHYLNPNLVECNMINTRLILMDELKHL